MTGPGSTMNPDRCFSREPNTRARARDLYQSIADLPLVCPHGHVAPELLADPGAHFGSPAELFIVPDHYIFRMLYSQGVPLEELGVPTVDGSATESDPRKIWQKFADNYHLFRGTPTALWLEAELATIFGIEERLTPANGQRIYDQLDAQLGSASFRPRALFERFNIEVLCTTDAATDSLEHHERLHKDGLPVLPTFRPDSLLRIDSHEWAAQLRRLQEKSGRTIGSYRDFVTAIGERRTFFKSRGCKATDHASLNAEIRALSTDEAGAIFDRAMSGAVDGDDALRFNGHMLMEMARMSSEDGLVMQLHVGSLRNHDRRLFERFGPDKGADIPVRTDWTRGLQELLNEYGTDDRFRLVLYTLDESSYSRELAPMAGYYPAVRLGAPWWFFDSVLGMERYLDGVVETAGIYNLAGFNDDTRAFASIPTRHDVWRRTSCNWLAGMIERGLMHEEDAPAVARWFAYDAGKVAYRLDRD